MINFESTYDKEARENIELPMIDPDIQKRLGEEHLDILWTDDKELIKPTQDSFYVPAILAFYGWKINKDTICKFVSRVFD